MATRYYELILSGRQLAVAAAGLVGCILVAFALGVGVGLQQRRGGEARAGDETPVVVTAEPQVVAAPALSAGEPPETEAPAAPTPVPTSEAALVVVAAPQAPAPAAAEVVAASPAPAPPRPTRRPAPTAHWVQVAALSRPELAEGVRQRVLALGFRPEQVVIRPGGGSHRVRLGPFPDAASAARVVSRLRAQGFGDAFAVSE